MRSLIQRPRSNANMRKWIAMSLVFTILFWWLALADPDEAEDVTAAVSTPTAPAPQPSAAAPPAETSLTAQHRAAPVMPTKAASAVSVASPSPAPETSVERGPEAPIPPDTRGFIDAIAGRYEEDSRDRDAAKVEAALQKHFHGSQLPASALRSVVCRKSVCKLELYWRPEYDRPYRSTLDELAGGNAKLIATRAEQPDKHGGVSVDAYWLRVLGTLPELPKP
jgi:hypothetical protein